MALVTLGNTGVPVSKIGFGLMGLSAFYGKPAPQEHVDAMLNRALELGCSFWDTADLYGGSEDRVGEWFAKTGRRSEVFLATKFAYHRLNDDVMPEYEIRGDPAYIKEACESSLRRLQTDHIDLYYQHRTDPNVPIETTVGAMAELVQAGKVKYLGLSECSEATLRRAYKVHPIAAVQIEYSPYVQYTETVGLAAACRELGVALIGYSPLSRGALSGTMSSATAFAADDVRPMLPFFQQETLKKNEALLAKLNALAESKGVTTSQLVLAWIVAKGVIPIPGTTKLDRLDENFAQLKNPSLDLTPAEVAALDALELHKNVAGERYPEQFEAGCLIDTPELV
ncbi:NADP-dependent oxidoreductase domain-containing protein [Dipodascopsis tothii]|uniref:NADP-dependent oxidoreductase domain-containing protein n=1 Tax=Dipodascopsis tothii TaxID=44089 RepID=UPI0034CF0836